MMMIPRFSYENFNVKDGLRTMTRTAIATIAPCGIRGVLPPPRQAPPVLQAPPPRSVIILPGFCGVAADYSSLTRNLHRHSPELNVTTANVNRLDWVRILKGCVDPSMWRGTLRPRPTVDWYLKKIEKEVEAARKERPDAPISLLAHSAGGWLARLFLLDFNHENVDQLVTLGSPHLPPPPETGIKDHSRGMLRWVDEHAPGAYHDDIEYVTVAGKLIQGADPLRGPGKVHNRVVGAGYRQVYGRAEEWGDGVVPVTAAHLEGATQVTLDGVFHSPLRGIEEDAAAAVAVAPGTPTDDVAVELVELVKPKLWYGSMPVLEQWAPLLCGKKAKTP